MDVFNTNDNSSGLSLSEVSFGRIHSLERGISSYGDESYKFQGHLHKSEIAFYYGSDYSQSVPVAGNGEYGFTLEGDSRELFYSKNAYVSENNNEGRTYIYINEKTKLFFNGSTLTEYSIYFRVFKEEVNNKFVRWISIYAEKITK